MEKPEKKPVTPKDLEEVVKLIGKEDKESQKALEEKLREHFDNYPDVELSLR